MEPIITLHQKTVILSYEDYAELTKLKERAEMKLRQLTSPTKQFDEFGGIGTGNDVESRAAYVRAFEWLLGVMGEPTSEHLTKKLVENPGRASGR